MYGGGLYYAALQQRFGNGLQSRRMGDSANLWGLQILDISLKYLERLNEMPS